MQRKSFFSFLIVFMKGEKVEEMDNGDIGLDCVITLQD